MAREDERDWMAAYRQAVMLHQRGREEEAIEQVRRAIALDAEQPVPWAQLAIWSVHAEDRETALDAAGRALRLAPAEPHCLLAMLIAQREFGRRAQHRAALQSALAAAPDDPSILRAAYWSLSQLRRRDEALEMAQRLVAIAPDWSDAHACLGEALHDFGREDESERAFRDALRLEPDQPRHQARLGVALLEKGREEEALRHLHEAARLEPDERVFRRVLGQALERHLGEGLTPGRALSLGCLLANPLGAALLVLWLLWTLLRLPFRLLRQRRRWRGLHPTLRAIWAEHLRRRRNWRFSLVMLLLGGLWSVGGLTAIAQGGGSLDGPADWALALVGLPMLVVAALGLRRHHRERAVL